MPIEKSKVTNKGGRPRNPPPAPAQGIAERSGAGWKFTIVLGGLKVNGKRFDPQAGAELLAGMLEDGMQRITRAAAPATSPEAASQDLPAPQAPTEDPAPGENGHN